MILTDTNVLSEVLLLLPDPCVARWMSNVPRRQIWTCTIVVAELLTGIEVIPPGRKQAELALAVHEMVARDFAGQILSFDLRAARQYAVIRAKRQKMGRPIKELDAQIAAIAAVHGATLATRNARDFEDCGIKVINPWEAA